MGPKVFKSHCIDEALPSTAGLGLVVAGPAGDPPGDYLRDALREPSPNHRINIQGHQASNLHIIFYIN